MLPYSRLGHGARPVGRPGALGSPRRASRADARSRPGVRRADDDLRPPDARSGAGLHVERAARREDDLPRAAVGGPRPRAEQPRVRDRTERGAPREPARGRRAGGARARRGGPDGRPVRRDRRGAQRVRGRARAGSAVADRARRTRRSHHRLARRPRPRHGRRRGARRNRRDDRGARSARRGRRRSRAQRRVALGGRRMLGPPPRLGDPGRRDADRRPGPGGQGLHAHGPVDRRGAGGSRRRVSETRSPF